MTELMILKQCRLFLIRTGVSWWYYHMLMPIFKIKYHKITCHMLKAIIGAVMMTKGLDKVH